VISKYSADTALFNGQSILPRLNTSVFSKAENLGRFLMIHPVCYFVNEMSLC